MLWLFDLIFNIIYIIYSYECWLYICSSTVTYVIEHIAVYIIFCLLYLISNISLQKSRWRIYNKWTFGVLRRPTYPEGWGGPRWRRCRWCTSGSPLVRTIRSEGARVCLRVHGCSSGTGHRSHKSQGDSLRPTHLQCQSGPSAHHNQKL